MRFRSHRLFRYLPLLASLCTGAGGAFAGDLIAGPATDSRDGETWTGVHAGIGIGARLANAIWTTDCLAPEVLPDTCANDDFGGSTRIGNDNPADFRSEAPRFSGHLGINWQLSSLVLGIEADAAWADSDDTRVGIPGTWSEDFGADLNSARVKSTWDASLRARAGFLVTPRTLLYSTGGLALLHAEVGADCAGVFPVGWCVTANSDSKSRTLSGWTLGGGIERMISKAWMLRGEYRYSDYGSQSFTLFDDAPLDSIAVAIEQETSLAYVGISHRF